jgi:hypothetical protein
MKQNRLEFLDRLIAQCNGLAAAGIVTLAAALVIIILFLASCSPARELTTYQQAHTVTEVRHTAKGVFIKVAPAGTATPLQPGKLKVGDTVNILKNHL